MNAPLNTNIDSLLDGTLDDLADMPEFRPFPPGAHRCALKMEVKKVNEQTAVEVTLTAKSTEELANADDTPLNPGDSCNILYFLTHSNPKVAELGQGQFKNLMKPLAAHFGAKSNRELIAESEGTEVLVVTSLRQNKDKTKTYTEIVEMVVA